MIKPLKLKPSTVYLFTVMHSNGLVIAAATRPAVNDDITLLAVSLFLYNSSPYFYLNVFIMTSYIVNYNEINVVYVNRNGVTPTYRAEMPFVRTSF